MSRKKVFIEDLNVTENSTLQEGWKNGKSYAFRNRCQCILMSFEGYDASALSKLFAVRQKTIYEWLKNWKKHGILGIITQKGQGRKPKLSIDNETHVAVVEKAAKNAAEKGTNMKDEVLQKLDIKTPFSDRTLRRFLRKKSMLTRDFVDTPKKK